MTSIIAGPSKATVSRNACATACGSAGTLVNGMPKDLADAEEQFFTPSHSQKSSLLKDDDDISAASEDLLPPPDLGKQKGKNDTKGPGS